MRITPFLLAFLIAPASQAAENKDLSSITCEGTYRYHLQGVCTDGQGAYFWSFTTRMVKTDRTGKVLKQVDAANHHGDLCFANNRVYVAVNLGKFNDPKGNADSWVYVYDADLALVAKHRTPEAFHGAGGIAFRNGRFFVVGGLPEKVEENFVHEYDGEFRFLKKHVLASGHTHLGIQTAAFADGYWWFGCYGKPAILLRVDPTFKTVERFEFDCSLGIVPMGDGKFLVARGGSVKDQGLTGRLIPAEADKERGLKLIPTKK